VRRFAYWAGATILVVALLVAIFSGAGFISEQHWPFSLIWGGFIAALGVTFIIVGRAFPGVLWGIKGSAVEHDPRILHRAAWIATISGAGITIGGLAFALTARVDATIGALILSSVFFRIALRGSGNDDLSGPAA